MRIHDLVPVLELAIGPVILISGVGLLLLSMTNRLGRVIDRARLLSDLLRQGASDRRDQLAGQLRILSRRARLVQSAIAFASFSVLLAALMIIALFISALLRLEAGPLITVLFISCMVSLILSLIIFIKDINYSLRALELEIEFNQDESEA